VLGEVPDRGDEFFGVPRRRFVARAAELDRTRHTVRPTECNSDTAGRSIDRE
jgi:hypothetical protein